MSCRCLITSALLLVTSHLAIALNLRSQSGAENATVCISLAAFEEPAYIEALINNFFHFSEPSTRIAIHLNAESEYNGREKSWASDRVAITGERIKVRAFRGSVLYSHLLNAKHMEKQWPGVCKYWVLQASNMMWVRSGMEDWVRKYEFSPINVKPSPTSRCAFESSGLEAETYVGLSRKLASPKKLYGRGETDGSFFPMDVLNGFVHMMDEHLKASHDDGEGIYNTACYFENVWLQTYALNWAKSAERLEYIGQSKTVGSAVCRMFSVTRRDNLEIEDRSLRAGKVDDSIPMSEVLAVMKGTKEGYEGFFAVKRVNRNLNHHTTQYIIGLSK